MESWICKNCETENDGSVAVCSVCGARRDAQPDAAPNPVSAPAQAPRANSERDASDAEQPRRMVATVRPVDRNADAPAAGSDSLRARIRQADNQKNIYKALAVLSVLIELALFAVPYVSGMGSYTVYQNCLGSNGAIEQICSILLVCASIAPAVAICLNLNAKKRNLPVTISVTVAILTTIYCAVILFGNEGATVIPVLIALLSWACVACAILLVKTLNKLDNVLYRPKGF